MSPQTPTQMSGPALGNRPWSAVLLTVFLAAVAAPLIAQVGSLYFREVAKDGRIFVFNTSGRFVAWQQTGEMGSGITLEGRGANGETLVGENEAAIELYLFKHNLPAWDRPAPPPAAPAPPTLPQVKVGTNIYLSYQDGTTNSSSYSKFVVKRAYLDVTGKLTPYLSFRVTPDITQDSAGDYKFRLKFAYLTLGTSSLGPITRPTTQLGMIITPWIDFEEKVQPYRMQDTLYLERVGIMQSADAGLLVGGLIGPEMPEAYQKSVSSAYPGRYGSFSIGVYNGGGYTLSEANTNKVIEGRVSVRPLPDIAPGVQVSYFGVSGKGNNAKEPDWTLNLGSLTYQSRYLNLVGTYIKGRGNARGDAVDPATGRALDREGWSAFAEGKLSRHWSVIARHDHFVPDTRATEVQTERSIYGVCYHLAKGYDLLLDRDELTFDGTAKPKDTRTQLTFQVKL